MRALFLLAVVWAAALGGCNAIVGFNPEDQPCNPNTTLEEEKCLEGYVCQDGKCRKGTGAADAGP